MNQQERTQFVTKYGQLLSQAWSEDGKFIAALKADPSKVLLEFGLDPQGAQINIITTIQEDGSLEDQIRLWEEGKTKGAIDLYIPLEQPAELSEVELSDEELEAVAGGAACSCTCTPCCSCCC
ncbi:MAG: hypothetical protein GX552_00430 [Chloroflexi bacterium]|jgi:natural product precursor|nr:hypothetical protein [Chloroflexota bacterium]